jgi:hypothetical protein
MNEFSDGSGQRPGSSGPPEPVFTATRRTRSRGPGRGPLLGSIAAIVVIGGAVAWWLRGGDAAVESPPAEPVAEVAADTAPPETEPVAEILPADTAPPPPPPIRLTIDVEPAGASVTVDDSLTAIPDSGLLLVAGAHTVAVEADGYFAVDTVVELTSDASFRFALRPTHGTLRVSASLAGRVFVNGRDRGAAPLAGIRLRGGTYTVRFVPETSDRLAEERRIRVTAGQSASTAFEITDGLVSVSVRNPRWATVYNGDVKLGDTPLIARRLPARVYTLRVARDGYVEQERLVRLEPGQVFEWVDVVLEEETP